MTPGESQQDEWDWENTSRYRTRTPFLIYANLDDSSTTSAAWCQLLDQTSLVAKSKLRLVDDINGLVVDSLRSVATRKDEARKKVKEGSSQ